MKLKKAILYFAIAAIVLCSCNATKRAYKRIDTNGGLAPRTNEDSQRLARRSLATFPVKKEPVIKKGTPVVDKSKDSTSFYKKLLTEANQKPPIIEKELEIKYKDTCTSAVDTYEQGYKLGYDIGFYDGKSKCPPSFHAVDTIEIIPTSVQVEIDNYRLQANGAIAEKNRVQEKLDKAGKKISWLIIAVLVLLLGNVLQFKKVF